jgi:carbonic anhydrase
MAMRLFEAILEASQRRLQGDATAAVRTDEYQGALPVAVLTCIDPRLNQLIPQTLALPEEKIIWLRNAGNIITGTLSSTMRSLAMACAIKGGREIAIVGHTDCQVGKISTLTFTDAMKRLGVERQKLPENLVEYFGLFASERQNVMTACEHVRNSSLIGSQIPVHGFLVDTQTGRLEWLVNGYQTLEANTSQYSSAVQNAAVKAQSMMARLEDFKMGTVTVAETQIGETITTAEHMLEKMHEMAATHPRADTPAELVKEVALDLARGILKQQLYKIIGTDQRTYGPIPGAKLIQWLAEERVDAKTPIQVEGSTEWRTVEELAKAAARIKPPPFMTGHSHFKDKR